MKKHRNLNQCVLNNKNNTNEFTNKNQKFKSPLYKREKALSVLRVLGAERNERSECSVKR